MRKQFRILTTMFGRRDRSLRLPNTYQFFSTPEKTICKVLIIVFLAGCLISAQLAYAISGTLIIPGTGDATNILRALARSFEEKNPGTKIIIQESIGSSGGIKMLLENRAVLARIARPLRDKEKKLNLTAIPFALSPIVFAVNSQAAQLKNINVAQIVKIYNGSLQQWHDLHVDLGTIYPVTREEGDSSLLVLEKKINHFGTDNKSTAKVVYSTPKTIRTLLRYKQTIGFIPMSGALDTDLHVLAIDNIYPSLENVQTGKYKYVVPFSLVYKSTPSPLSQAFIDFTSSLDGLNTIFKNGATPTT